LINNPNVVV